MFFEKKWMMSESAGLVRTEGEAQVLFNSI